ncbi:DUF1415 domain-containing protein [Paralcaligenes sp. KSB-10]|uniref:DUF1415 domain-containing protein n=1 Tax=Paralcaligenes sp. KSB-10 TaxID=2901142 RepID=UPI001E5C70C4|nr:DUF1415 domain-containing protein [Paralcaligenes sp. KSB-10]UHL64776.1 DUF1415 domain-containing protein [Paralcaligenes sp. KSB-10]
MNKVENDASILAATQHWLVRAVIGLNLCPFAKSVYIKKQIRYVIDRSISDQDVLAALEAEMIYLADADPAQVDTSLLIVPDILSDFLDYNNFLNRAQRLLKRMRLTGVLQIASFHPRYQFADRGTDDIENYTNRAPYPIFQLLREASIERALAGFSDTSTIYERNQETLRRLGHDGWHNWLNKPADD